VAVGSRGGGVSTNEGAIISTFLPIPQERGDGGWGGHGNNFLCLGFLTGGCGCYAFGHRSDVAWEGSDAEWQFRVAGSFEGWERGATVSLRGMGGDASAQRECWGCKKKRTRDNFKKKKVCKLLSEVGVSRVGQ